MRNLSKHQYNEQQTLHQARRIADHAVFLYLGEVVEEGPAATLFGQPREDLTRKYLAGIFS